MTIRIDSCTEGETILVRTRFSVYELIVLSGDGDVLVRGGRHFRGFRRAVFLGSAADGGSIRSLTIAPGLRMRFVVADELVITSAVESFSGALGSAASPECAQCRQPEVLNAS